MPIRNARRGHRDYLPILGGCGGRAHLGKDIINRWLFSISLNDEEMSGRAEACT